MADLCSLEDVKNESIILIDIDTYDTIIENKLEGATLETLNDAQTTIEELESISDAKLYAERNYWAKMAAVYLILDYLENIGAVPALAQRKVSTIRDSQATISFKNDSSSKDKEDSYASQYKKYIRKLKPTPPVGGKPRRRCYY